MKRYRSHNATTSRHLYLKKNIGRSRRRAKLVGVLYLLGIVALAALFCLKPLLTPIEGVSLGITEFYKGFTAGFEGADNIIKFAISVLYAICLLVIVVNVIKGLSKLGWLCKKTGTKEYGFNRNAYAMEDLGALFTGTFVCIFINYLLIGVLMGGFIDKMDMMMYVVIGVAAVIHLIASFLGAKVRYYDLENGQIVEQKRLVGRFACLMRNILQIAAIAGILFFLDFAWINAKAKAIIGGDMAAIIPFAMMMVILVSVFVLIKHAFAATEFSMEGIYGAGMKVFRVFTFISFLAAVAAVVLCVLGQGAELVQNDVIFIAVISFASFIIEVLLRKYPRLPEDIEDAKWDKQSAYDENEFTFEALARMEQTLDVNNHSDRKPTVII